MYPTMSGCSLTSDIHFVEYSSTLQLFKLSNIQTLQTFQTRNVSLFTLTCIRRCQVVLLHHILILWNAPQPFKLSNIQTLQTRNPEHGTLNTERFSKTLQTFKLSNIQTLQTRNPEPGTRNNIPRNFELNSPDFK